MRYLTKEWYKLCQTWPMTDELRKRRDDISAAYRQAWEREQLPDHFNQNFMFHDGIVQKITTGTDFIIQIDSPFSNYHKITFLDAKVKQEPPPTGAWWLYEELYRRKNSAGYEAHILFSKGADELFDTIVICRDILLE